MTTLKKKKESGDIDEEKGKLNLEILEASEIFKIERGFDLDWANCCFVTFLRLVGPFSTQLLDQYKSS